MAGEYFGPDYASLRRRSNQAGTEDGQRSIFPLPVAMGGQPQASAVNPMPSYARPQGMGSIFGGSGNDAIPAADPISTADPNGMTSGPAIPDGSGFSMGAPSGGGNGTGPNTGGPSGRGALTALSMFGMAVPNPISSIAGLLNAGMSWNNMNQLDANRSAYGLPQLNVGQRAGGVLGVNGYGRSSTMNDFNGQMAQAISRGQPVTVPNINAPTSPGGLNPGEAPSFATDLGGLTPASLADMGYSGGFGVF